MNGFYVPGSISGSYVANKRTDEGSLMYEALENEVGLQKQAALQQLDKAYSQTIENAYAAYLNSNRAIAGSNMGQGYKELYKQMQEQQLASNTLATAQEVANQRATLESQEAQAQQQIGAAFQKEVSYFDRLQKSMSDYFEYAKTLTDADGNGYFDPYELNESVDSMYDILSRAQPVGSYDAEGNYIGYSDESGKMGMTYSQWIASQIGTSEEDSAWYQWFLSGGLNEFLNAPKKTRQWKEGELKTIREEEIALNADLAAYKSGESDATYRVRRYLQNNPELATEIEKERKEAIKVAEEEKRRKSSSDSTMNSMLV